MAEGADPGVPSASHDSAWFSSIPTAASAASGIERKSVFRGVVAGIQHAAGALRERCGGVVFCAAGNAEHFGFSERALDV